MEPKFQVGDKVVSIMSNMMCGATGRVVDILEGRGGQNFVYVVGIDFEFPETGLIAEIDALGDVERDEEWDE